MRILATPQTLDQLFEPCLVPYRYRDEQEKTHDIDMPGWKCRACSWTSLKGVNGLPFPHECAHPGGTTVVQSFTTLTDAQG
jgi:hypothetical protein